MSNWYKSEKNWHTCGNLEDSHGDSWMRGFKGQGKGNKSGKVDCPSHGAIMLRTQLPLHPWIIAWANHQRNRKRMWLEEQQRLQALTTMPPMQMPVSQSSQERGSYSLGMNNLLPGPALAGAAVSTVASKNKLPGDVAINDLRKEMEALRKEENLRVGWSQWKARVEEAAAQDTIQQNAEQDMWSTCMRAMMKEVSMRMEQECDQQTGTSQALGICTIPEDIDSDWNHLLESFYLPEAGEPPRTSVEFDEEGPECRRCMPLPPSRVRRCYVQCQMLLCTKRCRYVLGSNHVLHVCPWCYGDYFDEMARGDSFPPFPFFFCGGSVAPRFRSGSLRFVCHSCSSRWSTALCGVSSISCLGDGVNCSCSCPNGMFSAFKNGTMNIKSLVQFLPGPTKSVWHTHPQ